MKYCLPVQAMWLTNAALMMTSCRNTVGNRNASHEVFKGLKFSRDFTLLCFKWRVKNNHITVNMFEHL